MNISLNGINTFLNLSETLNFKLTAQNCNISQPAVSKQIKHLEEELGVTLFSRNQRRVSLTLDGEALKKKLNRNYYELLSTLNATRESYGELSGLIRLGSLHEFGDFCVSPLIMKFMHMHPKVKFEVQLLGNQEIINGVCDGHLDIGIGITPLGHEYISAHKLLAQDSFLATSIETNQSDFFIPSEEFFTTYKKYDPLVDEYLKKFFPNYSYSQLKVKLVANSHEMMVNYMKQNPGTYAILPSYSGPVQEALVKGDIVKIEENTFEGHLYIFNIDKGKMEKRIEDFRKFILSEIKETIYSHTGEKQ